MKDDAAAEANAGKVTPPGGSPPAQAAAPTSDDADARARPGRRTVEERHKAVTDLLAGKATVDQIARRLGVQASTVEGWREDATGGHRRGATARKRQGAWRARAGAQEPRFGKGRDAAVDPEVPAGASLGSRAAETPYTAREVTAMNRQTDANEATVSLLCATFVLSRAAYYAAKRPSARRLDVVPLPTRPRYTAAAVVLAAIRAVVAREPAWGVRKCWATLRRDGLKVSRKRVWALMHANGLYLVRDTSQARRHATPPYPSRTAASRRT